MTTSERFHQIEDLFHRAKELAPETRAAFLDGACGGDLDLRSEVESLLAHTDRKTDDMRPPAPDGTPSQHDLATIVDRGPVSEGPGVAIGPYKILQQIGEGGFGVVYMAEQEKPVRRMVAVKVIKLGMDTKQVIARFEAERQALALMDHTNIARVLDAGATETGRPYFVMELVRGIPITEYCDQRKLSARDRLELFIDVCHAVQHAHHKGIIHRDLKPSNILVTLHDHKPVPKIIDFGIAKATSQRLTEKTLFTEFRQFIGTPEYMSPDQADISGLDIDTRSDIYQLGAVLYELLTGTPPHDPETLRSSGYAEMQRIIREVDPPTPSTRIHTLATTAGPQNGHPASAVDIAGHRGIQASALERVLRGDLDWIIMKAMEKDRTRRYDSANALADDVDRYLGDQPVLAGPPSVVYKLRKFVRRHRLGVTAGVLIGAALVVGATVAATGFVQAAREARHSVAVSDFLQSLVMELDRGAAPGQEMTVAQIVDRARTLFGDDHAVVGTLMMSRASSLGTSGRTAEAIESQREALAFFRKAHGDDHPSVAAALTALAKLNEEEGDLVAAQATYREALEVKRRIHGPRGQLVADAVEDLREFLVHAGGQTSYNEVKALWAESVDLYREALGADHPVFVKDFCKRAIWLHEQGFHDEAAPVLPEAVRLARGALDDRDLTRFLTLNAYAQQLILQQDNVEDTMPVLHELLEMSKGIWGPKHIASLSICAQGALLHAQRGEMERAGEMLREYLDARRDAEVQSTLILIGVNQQVWVAMEAWLDENPTEGREFFLHFIDDLEVAISPENERNIRVLGIVGDWMVKHDFATDAVPLLERAVALQERHYPHESGDRVRLLRNLGGAQMGVEDYEASERSLLRSLRDAEAASLAAEVPKCREHLVWLYERWDKPDEADRYRTP
ncbi:MAG: serine/threonine protein kinase [Planctomycetota bacterium]|jgi:serine/threonine protein kinase/tetratricopeptide (TPR) repeat protein